MPILPDKLRREIAAVSPSHGERFASPEELLFRRRSQVSLRVGGRRTVLSFRPTAEEVERVLLLACRGSLYSYRDCLSSGFLPMRGGIRVGISGYARCDGGRLVGVSEVESLLFRIPSAASDVGDELFSAYCENDGGMLVFSPPGGGKTTALRALALRIGQAGKRLVIADDRGEFPEESFSASSVSILRGYPKGEAVGVAVRTLSPEVLLVDEIGSEKEARALALAAGVGVPLLASAHAGSFEELTHRTLLFPLLQSGAFSLFAEIRSESGKRRVRFFSQQGQNSPRFREEKPCLF